ncbi:MAG: ribosome biogenesis GTPase Der [Spirochaetaceae bacterium]|jgi:GTP-binding protein|nr:ribosome biogenesis GTPase Der [Spirochaetaceae bacterium]
MDFNLKGLPRVVLAGRPNVGKSTLFNRLAHKRRAITDPTPGVTRDAVEMDIILDGKPLRLIDTGGFKLERGEDGLDALVVERAIETIRSADLLILLFDAGEITAEDEEFIILLRPYSEKIIACVNKTEGGRLAAEACAVAAYGFNNLFFISAEHGDNIAALTDALLARLDFSKVEREEESGTRPLRIMLAGKPNTGKSTLANRLTSSNASLVSDIAGTTRDVIEGAFVYKSRRFLTLDTAGIRRKNKINENIEYYSVNRAIRTMDEADIVLHLIDAEEGLSEQDKKIAALACERGRPVIFVLNKWDKMPDVKNTFNAVRDRLRFLFPQMAYAPVLPVSAASGEGVGKMLDMAIAMHGQLYNRLETSAFNNLLRRWQDEYPPPSGPRTRFKIKYGLQVSENPVIFKVFVSRPQAWTESYGAYIRNRLRADAGFSMIPVRLDIAPSRERRGRGAP